MGARDSDFSFRTPKLYINWKNYVCGSFLKLFWEMKFVEIFAPGNDARDEKIPEGGSGGRVGCKGKKKKKKLPGPKGFTNQPRTLAKNPREKKREVRRSTPLSLPSLARPLYSGFGLFAQIPPPRARKSYWRKKRGSLPWTFFDLCKTLVAPPPFPSGQKFKKFAVERKRKF